ncbi:histone-lysine N-methyltransferase, H3 lysine-9 specific SUVH5-like [Phragmites australis]|uniref:histone-lysine N-methyltransferase, H3 lysine-9 specific SUVH5-like n=1 Tax=Phragmites australis TaxID=29695 RepID=UPI002D7754E5|nr:histone-lysine N-methyltransferase, H3 lysine-9 specific SUVH5-like [Phragmites australis]
MEGGGARVSPRASGARRHKALATWRFQSAFVRREIKLGDAFDAMRCGSETPEISRETVVGRGLPGPESDGGLGDGELQSSASDGGSEVSKRGGVGVGGDCGLDGFDGDAAAKKCKFCEGLENNGVATESHGAAIHSNLPGFQYNGAAKESNSSGKDCNSEGFRTGDGTLLGCRKRHKAVAPWRFLIGYKPKWSLGLCSGNGYKRQTEAPASKVRDGSKQCAPAMARNPSRVRVSAARNRPSVKVQKGTGSSPKKRKTNKDSHHQVMPNNKNSLTRENVLTTLREFRIIYRKLLEEEETKWRARGLAIRSELAAFNIYRERFCVNCDDQRYVGSVPGVQIGDVFNSHMELSIVGIHRAQLLPVDHIEKDGTCLAVSIVSYAQPSAFDYINNLDFLLHVGSMAAMSDQNIEGKDLALKQSMDTNTPVRVIYALVPELDEDCRPKRLTSYVYGGLYLVEKFCREETTGDRCVNTFHLRRMEGQQHIDIQEVLKTRKPEPFDGIFMTDISGGLEKIPISAINPISNEYPTTFHYISQIQYPLKYQPDPPSGCDCVGGCSVSQKCACAVKNGGEFPFSDIGLINDKPLIYECGPSCKCPPTCHNRVSQHGIKFRLQVFKTKSMGWGVRSLDLIPSGSFVCEYIGELLEDQEAQERTNDEYLFSIGKNYYDVPRWEGLCKTIPSLQNGPSEDEEIGFAVDALNWGNFAKFINHSCTPNLFAQNVLHDHDDKSMPHIMLFAGEDIPPLKDLSYDYNYEIDKVYDSDGNIKKKRCFCGSVECTGWLY